MDVLSRLQRKNDTPVQVQLKYRILGHTGLQVSELGLGGLFVSSFRASLDDAIVAVHRRMDQEEIKRWKSKTRAILAESA